MADAAAAAAKEEEPPSPTTLPPPPPPPQQQPPPYYTLVLRLMSKRRTWAVLFILVYALLLFSTWNSLKSILSWYNRVQPHSSPGAAALPSYWPAIYASVLLGAVCGVLSMATALAIAVPATLVTWITVVVLLAFFGKPRKVLVQEGRKITKEIVGLFCKILLKEGNLVAAVCAVLGYFALVRRNADG